MRLSVCQLDLWNNLHNNMCGGSWSIPDVCWFLHPLLWSNIGEVFHGFFKFSLFSTWWVYVDVVWDISCHVWEQEIQVLLVHSCIHWSAWWYIEYHSEFGQCCAWVHQTSGWVIFHVISQFFQLLSYERCSHEEFLFKRYIHWKLWFLGFNFIFCLCSPIFLNSIFMM